MNNRQITDTYDSSWIFLISNQFNRLRQILEPSPSYGCFPETCQQIITT